MEFAGREYIYLPQKKIDKLKKIENLESPPPIILDQKKSIEKKEEKNPSEDEEDKKIYIDNVSCDSNSICSISNKHLNDKYSGSYSDNLSCDSFEKPNNSVDEKEDYIQETDINIFSVEYDKILNKEISLNEKPIRCKKCSAILNVYSNLNLIENNKYKWICEFCKEINDIILKKDSIPLNKNIDYILEEPIEIKPIGTPKIEEEKKVNLKDDTSLIFCFDVSGSMDHKYKVEKDVYDKVKNCFNSKEINQNIASQMLEEKEDNDKHLNRNSISGSDIDSCSYSNNSRNSIGSADSFSNDEINYIDKNDFKLSRLEMIKVSIYFIIQKLLNESPNVKVGLVTFSDDVRIYGDCLSEKKQIKETNKEDIIKKLSDEYSFLISNPISKSSNMILSKLKIIKTLGSTALGPGIISSLSLLKQAKKGSRIFLCTDGCANTGPGSISEYDEESIKKSKLFYEKIGEEAEKKGVSINLITFKDEHSAVEILMKMVEKSGGEITRVTPEKILDDFTGLVENNIIGVDTNLEIILPKILTFRNENKNKLNEDETKYEKKVGNIKSDMIEYFEFKFKKSKLLSDMNINLNNIKNLPIQCIIEYRDNNNNGKYIKVFTELKRVSSDKENILKQANLKIVAGSAIQKSAQLAKDGEYKKAQVNSMAWKKFLNNNKNKDNNGNETYSNFKSNMNNFNQNLVGAQINNKNNGISDRLAGQIYNLSNKMQKK